MSCSRLIRTLLYLSLFLNCACARGPVDTSPGKPESQRFAEFLESIYQWRLADRPELATSLGLKMQQDKWDERSTEAQMRRQRKHWQDLRRLHSGFDYEKLNKAQQLNYRTLEAGLQLRIRRYGWHHHLSPVNQIVGIHLQLPGLLTRSHAIVELDDAIDYIKRVEHIDTPILQFLDQLHLREEAGFLLPRSLLPRLIQASESIMSGTLAGDENNNIIFADFRRKLAVLELSEKQQQNLLARLSAAISGTLVPAYTRLVDAFKMQQTMAVNDRGVWQFPDGDQFYQFLLQQFTTTEMTAAQIHQLGLQEVTRIHTQMKSIMDEVGFAGDLREFFAHLRHSPAFYFPATAKGREDYLELARQFIDDAQSRVKEILPYALQHPVQVKRIEAYREQSAPIGFYEGGAADGSTAGTIFLGMHDMSSAAIYDLNALLSHEGIPGHHLQLSVMHTQTHIPDIRKYYVWWSNTAFTEGWALYAEYLAEEMGLYGDAYSRFGRLAGDLWRACRLVVDTGLHAMKWTRVGAIDYLNENTASSLENNTRTVDRYLAVPGQATAFKIGMMKILELRQLARLELGDDFDLREFHHVVLKNGPIPLSLLEAEVQAWITSKMQSL